MEIYYITLGFFLGLGIIPFIHQIQRFIEDRAVRRSIAFTQKVDAEIARRELDAWGIKTTADTDWSK